MRKSNQFPRNVISVRADGIRNGDLAVVTSEQGESLANVIKLEDDLVSLQVFSGARGNIDG